MIRYKEDEKFKKLNTETGEIKGLVHGYYEKGDPYFLVYCTGIDKLCSIDGRLVKLFLVACSYMRISSKEYGINPIVMNQRFYDYVREYLTETADSYIAKSMRELCKHGLLTRDSPGVYIVNPKIVFKGKSKLRDKFVRGKRNLEEEKGI